MYFWLSALWYPLVRYCLSVLEKNLTLWIIFFFLSEMSKYVYDSPNHHSLIIITSNIYNYTFYLPHFTYDINKTLEDLDVSWERTKIKINKNIEISYSFVPLLPRFIKWPLNLELEIVTYSLSLLHRMIVLSNSIISKLYIYIHCSFLCILPILQTAVHT